MADISQSNWDETDASNNAAAPNGFPENMPFSGLNDGARSIMGAVKRFWGRIQGRYASTGSANGYLLTPDVALPGYVTGERYSFRANFANTGPATLNISGLGAKAIKKMTTGGKADLLAGDIQNGQPVTVEYDGADLVMATPTTTAEDPKRGWTFLAALTANSSPQLDFTGLDDTYAAYMFQLDGLTPATDNVDLLVRISANNGVSFLSTTSYQFHRATAQPGTDAETVDRSGMETALRIAGGVGNVLSEGVSGTVVGHGFGGTTVLVSLQSDVIFTDATTTAFFFSRMRGLNNVLNSYNAVRFFMSSGNIARGTIRVFGLRRG